MLGADCDVELSERVLTSTGTLKRLKNHALGSSKDACSSGDFHSQWV